MPKKPEKFEDKIKQLEEIINKLESGDEDLENSITLYEKGVALAKECSVMLDNAKQKINYISCEE